VPEDWAHLTPEHLSRLCALSVPAAPARVLSTLTTVKMPVASRPADLRQEG
jgi:hypothetical protein